MEAQAPYEADQTIMDLIAEFHKFYSLEKKLKTEMDAAREAKEGFEQALYDKFMEEGVQNIKTKLGTFYVRDEPYASIQPGMTDDFFEWLREGGNGDLIKETIHSRTLTAFIKEQTEGKELEEDDELTKFITVFTKHKIGVRGGK